MELNPEPEARSTNNGTLFFAIKQMFSAVLPHRSGDRCGTKTYLSAALNSERLKSSQEESVTPREETRLRDFHGTDLLSLLPIFSNPRQVAKSAAGNWSRSRLEPAAGGHDTCARTPYDRRDYSLLGSALGRPSSGIGVGCLGPSSVAPSDGHATRRSPTWKFNGRYGHVGEFLRRTCSRQRYAASTTRDCHTMPRRAPLPIHHGDEDARVRISIQ